MNRASALRDTRNFKDAYEEFVALARDSEDTIDRAWLLLNAAASLTASGQYDRARLQLDDVRNLPSISRTSNAWKSGNAKLLELAMGVELEEA
jgi:hypothetical protein